MIGFETIGSATVIAYDGDPVLTTDAWINDSAYFGSWTHDYEIPAAQMDAILRAKFHWFSHGHPDHLNVDALPMLSGAKILLSDHHGGRIYGDLKRDGYDVHVLPDRKWIQLSPRIAVYSMANLNQDSILLMNINGRLVVNTNDSPDLGASWHVRRIARNFDKSYILALHGWGGADMLNLFDHEGRPMTDVDIKRRPIAPRAQRWAHHFGVKAAIPFSSFHRFQRTDSAWANDLVPGLADYQSDPMPGGPDMLPAFVRVDCETDVVTELNPARRVIVLRPPEDFGDSWSDPLEPADRKLLDTYFQGREALADRFGFIGFRVGGTEHNVILNPDRAHVGITFDAPRTSLMDSIRYEFFDDMLIGNFMKTTLHGHAALYPGFTPYVAKYGDNGGAKTKGELRRYFGHYIMRDPVGLAMTQFQTATEQVVRRIVPKESAAFRTAKRLYYTGRA